MDYNNIPGNTGEANFYVDIEVPVSELHQMKQEALMRPVDIESDEFKNLVEDIKVRGLMNPPTVYRRNGKLIVVAGNHRLLACKQLNVQNLKVRLFPNLEDDDDIFAMQVSENVHRVNAKKGEIAKRIHGYSAKHPHLKQDAIAKHFKLTQVQVSNFLNFARRTTDQVKEAVDKGTITFVNAVAISKLPLEEQENWLDRAKTDSMEEFGSKVITYLSNLKKQNSSDRRNKNDAEGFIPVARLRSKPEILAILNQASTLCSDNGLDTDTVDISDLSQLSDDILLGLTVGLSYAVRLDSKSVNEAKEQAEAEEMERQQRIAEKQLAEKAGEKAPKKSKLETSLFGEELSVEAA